MRVYRRPRARLTPRLVVALLALVCAPRAPSALDIDWVGVGDRGNPADTAVMVTDGTSGYGQVAYSYDISRIEVTNTQYAELLNGVASCSDPHELFNPEMESDEINGGIEVVGPTICSVGDPGNPPDVNNLGSVADTYQIRPYETTNAEYAELLNAVAGIEDTNELYNPEMETSADGGILRTGEPETYVYTVKEGFEDKPVNFVSFWDAARFVNWLANGKPPQEGETRRPFHTQTAVTTENGSYNLTNEAAVANNTLTRKAGAEVFVPSRDEFYKAAYYDTASQAYYLYPAGSSDEIACTEPGDTPNTANCAGGPGTVADTGAYVGAPSPNGTFDQGGNVDEWTDTIQNFFFVWYRVAMGGGFDAAATALAASAGTLNSPISETATRGFRVARSETWQRYQAVEDFEDKPVNYVSVWDAFRFVNWLENGQPTGAQDASTTEDGSYTLTTEGIEANTIERNQGPTTFLSSEDEWYKAAYYAEDSQSYFTYPTGSEDATVCEIPAAGDDLAVPGTANCGDAVFVAYEGINQPVTTPTAAYPDSTSPFGTLDQAGNVFEWNDTIVESVDRGMRGGFYGASAFSTESIARASNLPTIESPGVGFRVTQIPEPVSTLLQWAALVTLALLGRRSAVG